MNNLYIYNKLTYFPCKTWWHRGTTLSIYAEGREVVSLISFIYLSHTADSGRPFNANSCRVSFNSCTMTFLGRFSTFLRRGFNVYF
jgi:hypothetical protein